MTQTGVPQVQWPTDAVSRGNDLLKPTRDLLEQLNLLETTEDAAAGPTLFRTPWSLQVVTAGMTAASKGWATAVTALGGSAAALAAIKAFWLSSDLSLRLAYTGASAFVLAVALLAVASIVRSDVNARAAATVATLEARARVTSEFLKTTQSAGDGRYLVKRSGVDGWSLVRSIRFSANENQLVIAVDGDDHVASRDIEALVPLQSELQDPGSS